jgi:hypothetical protein
MRIDDNVVLHIEGLNGSVGDALSSLANDNDLEITIRWDENEKIWKLKIKKGNVCMPIFRFNNKSEVDSDFLQKISKEFYKITHADTI